MQKKLKTVRSIVKLDLITHVNDFPLNLNTPSLPSERGIQKASILRESLMSIQNSAAVASVTLRFDKRSTERVRR